MDDMTDDPVDDLFDDDFAAAEDDLDGGGTGRIIDADSILDSIVPGNIDWKDTVRRHPAASVLGVGLVGYLVGRTKGATIMTGLTAALSAAMMRQLSDVFEGDFFDY